MPKHSSAGRQDMLTELNEMPDSKRLGLVWRGESQRVRATKGDHATANYALIVKLTYDTPALFGRSGGFAWAVAKKIRPPHQSDSWQHQIDGVYTGTRVEAAEIAMAAWQAFWELERGIDEEKEGLPRQGEADPVAVEVARRDGG